MRTCDVEVKIHHETEAAYLVTTTSSKGKKIWIPKRINGEEYEVDEGSGGWAVITVPEYWATEKELV